MTLVLIGVAGGFLAGLLGIGGGALMVPLMVGIEKIRQRQAHAISLGALVIFALAAAITYGTADEVRLGTAVALFAGGVFGAPVGAKLLASVDDALARRAFGAVMVCTAVYLALT